MMFRKEVQNLGRKQKSYLQNDTLDFKIAMKNEKLKENKEKTKKEQQKLKQN